MNEMETYKGYKQLKDITVKALILAGAEDKDTEELLNGTCITLGTVKQSYSLNFAIPLNVAITYASSCNSNLLGLLVGQGFVEVVEKRLIDIDQILRTGGIQKRGSGNLASKSAYLSKTFSWSIEIDDEGVQCLVPKRK